MSGLRMLAQGTHFRNYYFVIDLEHEHPWLYRSLPKKVKLSASESFDDEYSGSTHTFGCVLQLLCFDHVFIFDTVSFLCLLLV